MMGKDDDVTASELEGSSPALRAQVKCGDCEHFVKNGRCHWYASADAKRKDRPFAHAPFWVWSDCYSDKELVRADVETSCKTFVAKVSRNEPRGSSAAEEPCSEGVTPTPSEDIP